MLREFQTFCLEFMDETKYGLVRKDRQAGGTSVFVLFLIYKIYKKKAQLIYRWDEFLSYIIHPKQSILCILYHIKT